MSRRPIVHIDANSELGAACHEAMAAFRLPVGSCWSCGASFWHPRDHCPNCMSEETTIVDSGHYGSVHTFTVDRRPAGPYGKLADLIIAYIELASGPLVLSHIVDCAAADVRIGMPVVTVFDTSDDGRMARFRPDQLNEGPDADA